MTNSFFKGRRVSAAELWTKAYAFYSKNPGMFAAMLENARDLTAQGRPVSAGQFCGNARFDNVSMGFDVFPSSCEIGGENSGTRRIPSYVETWATRYIEANVDGAKTGKRNAEFDLVSTVEDYVEPVPPEKPAEIMARAQRLDEDGAEMEYL